MLRVLKSEVFIRGKGGGWGTRPPLSEFSGSAPGEVVLKLIYTHPRWLAPDVKLTKSCSVVRFLKRMHVFVIHSCIPALTALTAWESPKTVWIT